MPEGDVHRRLKRLAAQWLWERGYAAIAAEVEVPGVGVIDVVGTGRRTRRNPRRASFDRTPTVDRHHVVFMECKASRADFLRDQGRQLQFAFALSELGSRRSRARRRRPRHASSALGKFDSCLIRPHANLHYLVTPPRLIRLAEIPRRWGWMVCDDLRIRVARAPAWQEVADVAGIEGAVARSLTAQNMNRSRRAAADDVVSHQHDPPSRAAAV